MISLAPDLVLQEPLAEYFNCGATQTYPEIRQLQVLLCLQVGVQKSCGWFTMQANFSESGDDNEICVELRLPTSWICGIAQAAFCKGSQCLVPL